MDDVQNVIVYLIGFPGTGKYTIAQELVRRADFRLIDNHLINNPVFSLVHADGKTKLPEDIWDNVTRIWDVVLDTMVHISPAEYSFILTNHLVENDAGDLRHYGKIEAAARQRQALFVPVRLMLSDVNEHIKRITAKNRAVRMKENNPEAPKRYAAQQILDPGHPDGLTIDVTNLPATQVADAILDHVKSLRN